MRSLLVAQLVVALSSPNARALDGADKPPSFSRDVRPILSRCFPCHGPDAGAREAGLRLDTRVDATASRKRGTAIVPGQPANSTLYARVTAGEGERMPPAESGKPLSPEQIETLRRWITSGADYEGHWAFKAPQRPALPEPERSDWPRQPLDTFVLARLEASGIAPTPEADRYTLIRRLSLDLIGLPPSPQEADAFANDPDPLAYERLVDRLLHSPRYGERWARRWLDLARYADTNGYEKDRPRSIWPYRDWVIGALNQDLPYDQFSVEQIAGDMLPGATTAQRVATGFHRNTMLNEEGGIDPLEYRFYAMVDRVATTGTVWMGLTTGCAQCHSHKYDPLSQHEYYGLMALLDNADEPDLRVTDPSVAGERAIIEARIEQLTSQLAERFPPHRSSEDSTASRRDHFERRFEEWIAATRAKAIPWHVLRPTALSSNLPKLEVLPDGSVLSSGDITKRDVFRLTIPLEDIGGAITALRLEALPDERLPAGGPGRAYYEGRKGDFFLSEVKASANDRPVSFSSATQSYGKISIGNGTADGGNVLDGEGSTGWATAGREGEAHQLVLRLEEPLTGAKALEIEMVFERHFAASLGRFRWSGTTSPRPAEAKDMPPEVEALLARDPKRWSATDRAAAKRYFLSVTPELATARKEIADLRNQLPEFPTTLVLQERPPDNPRDTLRRHRGEYLSPREKVAPGLPDVLGRGTRRPPRNRLAFARWLVSPENPLVARVTVNRAWEAFFGTGLVPTLGDFGTQGDPPSHPRLLDWLAVELMESGWSIKALHRLLVTSATYRQGSQARLDLSPADPGNRLLARSSRFRLEAELVRDTALSAAGLLSTRIGGPSVFPPQPQSVTALSYGSFPWRSSKGEDRFRRSLYTFAKRTAPFAAYTVFDAPTGENCVARRDRSNTPLQALTLLNDGMFLEAARALAERARHLNDSPSAIATSIFRRCVTRPPDNEELAALLEFFRSQSARIQAADLDREAITGQAESTVDAAAWAMLARAVMNLDETVTRP